MVVTIDRHIDLPFGRTYLARVALHHRWSRLDALLNRHHWLHHRGLLRCCRFFLIFDTSENRVARTIAVIRDALTAHLVGQAIERLHRLDGMVVGRVDRLADAGIGVVLDGGLHSYMLFRR